jgi:hypothetical protein
MQLPITDFCCPAHLESILTLPGSHPPQSHLSGPCGMDSREGTTSPLAQACTLDPCLEWQGQTRNMWGEEKLFPLRAMSWKNKSQMWHRPPDEKGLLKVKPTQTKSDATVQFLTSSHGWSKIFYGTWQLSNPMSSISLAWANSAWLMVTRIPEGHLSYWSSLLMDMPLIKHWAEHDGACL